MTSSRGAGRVVRTRLADGTVKEYRYPPYREPKAKAHGRWPKDSIGSLITAYRMSQDFLKLRPRTKETYGRPISVWEDLGGNPTSSITRREILRLRDAIALKHGNGSANVFIRVTGTILSFAVDREIIPANPCSRIKLLETGELPAWSEEDAAAALAALPEDLRRVAILGLHTGQRRSDLAAMRWTDIIGSSIRVVPIKTSRLSKSLTTLLIPIHPELAAELAAWRRNANGETILETREGHRWDPQYLSRQMGSALKKIGLQAGLNVHGLRKLAATRLAEAGCSAHEIASITGHQTLAMVQLYTRSASQKQMAETAISRLTIKR